MAVIVVFVMLMVCLMYIVLLPRDSDPKTVDRTFLRLISPDLLHIFDQIMSLIPFATKTDMYEALKKADKRAATVDDFLAGLRLEHSTPNAFTQLKDLWTQHAAAYFPEPEKDEENAEGGGQGTQLFSAAVPTPPTSPRAAGGSRV
jgi:hypothetical protein